MRIFSGETAHLVASSMTPVLGTNICIGANSFVAGKGVQEQVETWKSLLRQNARVEIRELRVVEGAGDDAF